MIKISKLTMPYRSKLIIEAYKTWLKKGDKVLDIGCGNGNVTYNLINTLGINGTGCDIENYLIYDVPFIKISKDQKLPFSTKSYDSVLLNDVLHHTEKNKQEHILKEAIRVGKQVLIFEAEPTFFGKFADILLNTLHYGNLDLPLSFRSKYDWKILFKKLSLDYKIVKINKKFWYPFSHIAIRLKEN